MNSLFLFGHSVYILKWAFRAPIWLPPFLYALCVVGTVAKIVTDYDDLGLIIENSHMIIHMIVGLQTTLIAVNNKRVLRLSQLLDKFDYFPGLEMESDKIKADCENSIRAMYSTFTRCLLITISIYILFPLFKLLNEDGRSDLNKILVWPMWIGALESSWLGFCIVFVLEVVTCFFLLLSVVFTVPYLACLGKMTVGHCRYLSLALTLANEVSDVFKYYLSSFYYGGVLALCMSGIQAMAADKDMEKFLKFMGILTGELVAIGVATYVSEEIIQGFAELRLTLYKIRWYNYPKKTCKRLHLMTTMCNFPGLRTVVGYELTLFHFANILNASYKYYNLLFLTMKEKDASS